MAELKAAALSRTEPRCLLDTSIFNRLADGVIKREQLPMARAFAITHIQMDEINHTKSQERWARLLLTFASLGCELLPTETFLFDISRFDHAKWGDGKLYKLLKDQLDVANGGKPNNIQDALIAEAAIANDCILLTADGDLHSVVARYCAGRSILLRGTKP